VLAAVRLRQSALIAVVSLGSAGAALAPVGAQSPDHAVFFTWLTNTSWLIQAGETTLLFDGTITAPAFPPPSRDDPSTLLTPATAPDQESVRRVHEALLLQSEISVILIGHAHFDHSFDAGAWAGLTGARVVGSRSACYQIYAQGYARSRCRIVEGGEELDLGPQLRARVVRWHHSGLPTDALGRMIQAPIELIDVPVLDPSTGGLRPSGFQDFPNGGGSRAFLFSYGPADAPLRWFISDTGNPALFDTPAQADPAWFAELGVPLDNLQLLREDTPTREHLERALAAEGGGGVQLWLGYGAAQHVAQVGELLRPAAFIPHHWGGLRGIFAGLPGPYRNPPLTTVLRDAGVQLLVQPQYGARYRLDFAGVREISSESLRQRLGLAP